MFCLSYIVLLLLFLCIIIWNNNRRSVFLMIIYLSELLDEDDQSMIEYQNKLDNSCQKTWEILYMENINGSLSLFHFKNSCICSRKFFLVYDSEHFIILILVYARFKFSFPCANFVWSSRNAIIFSSSNNTFI